MIDEWNPRYVVYAAHHGNTPEQMQVADRLFYPGGMAVGFQLFISHAWRSWRQENGRRLSDILSALDCESFDTWLPTSYPARRSRLDADDRRACYCHRLSELEPLDERTAGAGDDAIVRGRS